MIESIFVHPLQIQGIEKSGANHLIVASDGLNQRIWQKLQNLGMSLDISINAFDKNSCPADPQSQATVFKRLAFALSFQPSEIWLDYFRFGGECTGIRKEDAQYTHQECKYCQGVNRKEIISQLSQKVNQTVKGRSKLGYFAIAFKDNEASQLSQALGVDYQELGKIFDLFSPMLYHRMLNKPVDYISEYVQYLAEKTRKPVLPIIQIKDMPDDLEDQMTEEDIRQAFEEAKKDPSTGVCFFWWVHALEKNKTRIISKLFSTVDS